MANVTWIAGSGDWNVAADWSDGISPNDPTTDVTIDVASAATITLDPADSFSANSVTIGSANSTLQDDGTLAVAQGVTVSAGTFLLADGTLESSSAQNAQLMLDGGSFVLGTNTFYTGTLDNISIIGSLSFSGFPEAELVFEGNTTVYTNTSETTPGTFTVPEFVTLEIIATSTSTGTATIGYTLDDSLYSPVLIAAAGSAEPTLLITSAGDVDGAAISPAITADGLAVINQGTLSAVNSINETIVATSLLNQAGGLITAGNATIVLKGSIDNAGMIAASGTGVLVLGGGSGSSLVNTGTIDAAGAGITIDADAAVDGLGSIDLSNGNTIVYAGGTLDNTGGTLGAAAAATALQGFTLGSGATLKGGELDTTSGFVVNIPTLVFDIPAQPATLDGVAIIGSNALSGLNIALAGGAAVYTDSSEATLATINLAAGVLYLTGSSAATLSQSVDISGGYVEAVTGSTSNDLTIGAATTIEGAGVIYAVATVDIVESFLIPVDAAGIINDGLVESNTSDLHFAASSLDNQGTLEATGSVFEGFSYAPDSIDIDTPGFTNSSLVEESNGAQINIDNGPGATGQAWTNEASGTITANTGTLVLDGSLTNQGVISAVSTSVTLDVTNLINAGTISANGGTTYLVGSIAVADLGNLGDFQRSNGAELFIYGTLDNTGETLNASTTVLAGLTIDQLTIDGGVLDPVGLGLVLPSFAKLDLNAVTVTDDVTIGPSNVLELAGGTRVYTDASRTQSGTISTNDNATIELAGASTTIYDTIDVAYDSALTAAVTTNGTATITIAPGGAVVGGGQINQNFYYNAEVVELTNQGLLDADASTPLTVATGGLTNLQDATLTGGTYEGSAGGTLTLTIIGTIETDAADIILNGTGSEIELQTPGPLVPIEDSLSTIAAGGVLSITGGRSYTTSNVITNDGTIIVTGGGTLTVGGFVNDGTLELDSISSFVNTALTNTGLSNGGVLVLNGGTYTSLTNDVGGTVEGSGVILGPVVNNGTVVVASGTMQIDGAVTGTGSFVIDPGAELVLDSSDAETVAFANAPDGNGGGELSLGQPALFTASLSGLTSDDTVDFSGADITAAEIAGSGTASLDLTLNGGGTLTVPLLATAVTGNALPPRYDGSNGTQMTLLPIAADTGQYASSVPGVTSGKDFAPAFTIVYGGTPGTAEVAVTSLLTNEGVNWFLDFPSLPAGTQSDAFNLAAINRNTGLDNDNVTFTLIGGGSDIDVLGGSSTIDGILPGGDSIGTGTLGLGPELAVQDGTPAVYEIHATANGIALPVETLAISVGTVSPYDAGFIGGSGGGGSGGSGGSGGGGGSGGSGGGSSGTASGENPGPGPDPGTPDATATGDVHMVTFDGLHYDFQQVGEFVLAKSTALGDSFEVQIRTQPYGVGSVVSVTVAMAVQVGADRVSFDPTRADMLWVNGKPVTLDPGGVDTLPGGTRAGADRHILHGHREHRRGGHGLH